MSGNRAERLRGRMSIDPDAPEPITRPLAPVSDEVPSDAGITETDDNEDSGPEAHADSDTSSAGRIHEKEDDSAPPVRATSVPSTGSSRSRSARSRKPRAGNNPGWSTALDDPAIRPDGNGYRSFYVSDTVFARFRSAIYWTARRDDAMDEVPDNMSAAIEQHMDALASELERRFNQGDVFRPTPEQVKAHRRRQDKTQGN